DSRFIFGFETDGSLTPKDALKTALKIMGEKCMDFEEKIKKI
ncbi:MAG: DNA-directed RNA polymerase subunit D, partial [Euryarchaeota archaeon CG_4_9_14_3_um_filter_38_12]